ncbi:MAG: ABC transporter permease, partial [Candidatus Aminicenantes bacterium]|nr:ABC transporter permease [Candidatus Aminicenantes bacterium]
PRFVPALLWNYFKVAARALRREKMYAAINVAGLSIGMACFILLGLWVRSELSFDRFHAKKDRIFRVLNRLDDGRLFPTPTYALAPELKRSYAEVEEFSRVWSWQSSLITRGRRRFQENRIGLADPGFFRMFTFPFIEGNAATALAGKDSVVLTESTAKKYFGREKALGKVLFSEQLQAGFRVTGVIRDIPAESHIQFDLMARVELLGEERLARWQEWTGPCYVLLRPGVSPAAFGEKIRDIYKKHVSPEVTYVPVLQELTRVNLEQSGHPDNIRRVLLFSLIAAGILLLACVNFINLLTARASRRAREISLRKIAGASRGQILRQFLAEALLMSLTSMLLALLWARLLLPAFNRLTSKSLSLFSASASEWILPLVLLALVTGLLAGGYPSLLLSRFRPVQVLRPQWHRGGSGSGLRRALSVFQFAMAAGLLTFTLAVNQQVRHIDTIELGFDRKNIIGFMSNPELMNHSALFKSELLRQEGVVAATMGMKAPTMVGESIAINWQGNRDDNALPVDYTVADHDYLKTFSMKIVAGRDFSPLYPADEREACIINETAARHMGVADPVGLSITMLHPAWPEEFRRARVVGVVRDFHSRTVHTALRPFVLRMFRPWYSTVFVRIDGRRTAAALKSIEATFKRHAPGYPFEFTTSDQAYESLYAKERVIRRLLHAFTLLSLLIACLGLIGLTAFTIEQKTREFGIRRVFGASILGIVWRNLGQFLSWVAVAHAIAWPAAYFLIRQWLRQFAYPVGIGPGLFALSAALILLVALFTVGYQTVRAARANPVESLRYE